MSWLRRLTELMARKSVVAHPESAGCESPESGIRRKLEGAAEVVIRELVPTGADLRSLQLRAVEDLYVEQRAVLDDRFGPPGIGVLVADYAMARTQDGRSFSYCVWTQGVSTLLPETEFVVMTGVVTQTRSYWEAIVPWQVFLRVIGDECLVQEPDLVPPRWRTLMWPPPRMLQELKAAAVRF